MDPMIKRNIDLSVLLKGRFSALDFRAIFFSTDFYGYSYRNLQQKFEGKLQSDTFQLSKHRLCYFLYVQPFHGAPVG